jgi:hypothetical protein
MAIEKVIDITINADPAIDATKSLRSQLREAQAEVAALSDKFGATSKEAVEAAKRAAELKDRIGDAKALTDAFNPDAKFKALTTSLSGVASGFAAVQGAMGLFGSESEAVEKTLLKVQSAMALSQGLQALGESMDSFKQLKAVAVNAMNAIKTAIGSTGIGLLVIALGTIYTYWDDIKEAVSGVSEEQRKLNALTHQNFETSKEELKTLNNQDNILKLQGKSETEILKLKIKKLDTSIKLGEIELQNVINTSAAEEKAAIENYKRTQQLLDLVVNFSYFLPKLVLTPIDLAIKGANKVSEILGIGKAISFDIMGTINEMQDKATSFISKQLFDPEQVKKDGEKTRKELQSTLNDLRNQRAGLEIQITNIENDEADKRKKKKDDEAENDKKRFEKELEERQKRLARIQELEQQNFNALNQKQKDFTATSLAGLEERNKQVADVDARMLEGKKLRAQAEEEIEQATLDVIGNGITMLKGMFEKNKAIQKGLLIAESAVGIAKIIVNTQTANAVAKASPINLADPTYGTRMSVINTIAAGIGIAANVAATAKALSQLGGGGGAGAGASAGSASGGGASAPSFNIVGDAGVNSLTGAVQQNKQAPIQTYVVAQNVTTAQSLNRNIVENATLG